MKYQSKDGIGESDKIHILISPNRNVIQPKTYHDYILYYVHTGVSSNQIMYNGATCHLVNDTALYNTNHTAIVKYNTTYMCNTNGVIRTHAISNTSLILVLLVLIRFITT